MFRQGLRSCAPLRHAVARAALSSPSPSLLLQRSTLTAAPAKASVVSLSRALQQFRFLATEATAEATKDAAEEPAKKEVYFNDMAIEGLVHPTLINTIVRGMGYKTMSEVQARTIRPAVEGKDLVAQAKTGTGKTIGFLLPTLQRMINEDPSLATRGARREASWSDVRGIVLSPTRELAEQIAVEARKLVQGTGLVVQAAVGGTQKREMLYKARREGCHLLVATPGRLIDLISDPSTGLKAPNLAAMVLDEADRMLDVGFADSLREINRYLPDVKEKSRQTLLFSATIPKDVIALARQLVRPDNFEFVQTINEDDEPTHARVPQHIVVANSWYNVIPSTVELIKREVAKTRDNPDELPFKAIIYTPTTAMVDLLHPTISTITRSFGRDFNRSFIHGKLTQNQRTRAAENFRRARSGILISSDVTARGMDFPNVSHVIQLGLPPSAEQYVHRLGRTGRAGKEGVGYIVIPQFQIGSTRQMLGAMPIKPDQTLETANIEPGEDSNSKHPILAEVAEAYQTVDPDVFNTSYLSLLGGVERRTAAEAIAAMNELCRFGFGMESPPYISEAAIQRIGLRNVPGVNTGRRSGGFGGGSGGSMGRSSSFSNSSSSSDPFDSMMNKVVDPNAPRPRANSFGSSFGSSFGGSGGFGGERRGGGGFGGDRRGGDRRGGGGGGYGGRGRTGGSGGGQSWMGRGRR